MSRPLKIQIFLLSDKLFGNFLTNFLDQLFKLTISSLSLSHSKRQQSAQTHRSDDHPRGRMQGLPGGASVAVREQDAEEADRRERAG